MSVVQYLNHSNRHRQVFNVPKWRREESIEPSEKSIKRIQKSDPKVWPNGNEVGEKYMISSHLFKSWWLELFASPLGLYSFLNFFILVFPIKRKYCSKVDIYLELLLLYTI